MEPSSPPPQLSSFVVPKKLFVGSITEEMDESALREYFEKYGQVTEVVVMRGRDTGKMRGFGFVEFVDKEAAEKALNDKCKHIIRDQAVDVKRARPKSHERRSYQSPHQRLCHTLYETREGSTNSSNNDENNTSTRKIFVGGLSSNITVDEFRSYFAKFGCITDVVIMYDNVKNQSRGFGFVTFDSEEAAKTALSNSFHELSGRLVEVKRAVPKEAVDHYMDESFYCGNDRNLRGGWLRGNDYGNYQPDTYLPYGPGYCYFYNYSQPPLPGYPFGPVGYEEGYTYRGYGEISYGAPYASPVGTWNGHGMMATGSVSYSNTAFDPRYVNTRPGGYMGMAVGAYHRSVWSGSSRLSRDNTVLPRKEAKITNAEAQNKVEAQ